MIRLRPLTVLTDHIGALFARPAGGGEIYDLTLVVIGHWSGGRGPIALMPGEEVEFKLQDMAFTITERELDLLGRGESIQFFGDGYRLIVDAKVTKP